MPNEMMKYPEKLVEWLKELKFGDISNLTTKFVVELSGEDKIRFNKWLKKEYILIIAFTIPIVTTIILWTTDDSDGKIGELLKQGGYGAEIFVLFLIYIHHNIRKEKFIFKSNVSYKLINAHESSLQFFKIWEQLVISWLILYLCLFLDQFINSEKYSVEYKQFFVEFIKKFIAITGNFFNNLSGIFFLALYWELSKITQRRGENEKTKNPPLKIGKMLILILFILELMLYIIFGIKDEIKIVYQSIELGFSMFSGSIVSIFTGLFIVRLGSSFLRISEGYMVVFILYVAIQPLYVFLDQKKDGTLSKELSLIIFYIALYGKLLLVTLVYWLHDSLKMLYYMIRVRETYEQEVGEKWWERFVNYFNTEAISENTEGILENTEGILENTEKASKNNQHSRSNKAAIRYYKKP